MGREFASAAARWVHLDDLGVSPQLAVVCDSNPAVLSWYERLDPRPRLTGDYREVLEDETVEAVYCAVPHHLHAEVRGFEGTKPVRLQARSAPLRPAARRKPHRRPSAPPRSRR